MPLPQYPTLKMYRPKRRPSSHRRRGPSKDGRRTALKRWNDNSRLPNKVLLGCVNAKSVETIVKRRRSNAKKLSEAKHKLSKLMKAKSKYVRKRSRSTKTQTTRMVPQPEPEPEPESEAQNLSSSYEFNTSWSASTFQTDFEHQSSIDPSVRPKCRMRSVPKKKEVKRSARKKIPTMKASACKRANPSSPSRKTTKTTKKVAKKTKTEQGKPRVTRIQEICSEVVRRPWWRFWSRDNDTQLPDAGNHFVTQKSQASRKKENIETSNEFIIQDSSIIDLTKEPPCRVPQGRVNKRIQVPSEP